MNICFFVTNIIFLNMIWLTRCMPWMCNEKRMTSNELAMKKMKLVKINLNYTIICFAYFLNCSLWENLIQMSFYVTYATPLLCKLWNQYLSLYIRNVLKSLCTEIGLKWYFFQVRWTMLPWICLEKKSKKMWKYVQNMLNLYISC